MGLCRSAVLPAVTGAGDCPRTYVLCTSNFVGSAARACDVGAVALHGIMFAGKMPIYVPCTLYHEAIAFACKEAIARSSITQTARSAGAATPPKAYEVRLSASIIPFHPGIFKEYCKSAPDMV